MKRTGVIGSLNIDVVSKVERFLKPGETASGTFDIFVGGGKGANQACALGRLGAKPFMAGCIGDTFYGPEYLRHLADDGVDTSGVRMIHGLKPGVAVITVSAQDGQNHIIVAPGANAACTPDWARQLLPELMELDIVLFQLETPLETTLLIARALREAGKTLILDPAPAVPLEQDTLALFDYVTPNETELNILTGLPTDTEAEIHAAARALLGQGARCVIAKAGGRGAFIAAAGETVMIPPYRVTPVDTTAAGDAFNAGLADALARGEELEKAVRFANAVGALATTAMGAQSALPTRNQVNLFLETNGGMAQ